MPPFITFVARQHDGLPLVASFAQTLENLESAKQEARQILRQLNSKGRSPAKMSIETSANGKPFCFHYLMQSNLVYLTLTESSYPKRLAFLYLDEVADAFLEYLTSTYGDQYFRQVETTARPFAFIQADPIIQRKQREFIDPKSNANSNKLNQDLSDIHSIMKQNINQVLDRGEKLEHVSQISSNLMSESKKFKWGAKKLNWWAKVYTYLPVAMIVFFLIIVVYLHFFHRHR